MELIIYICLIIIALLILLPVLALYITGFILEGIALTKLAKKKHVKYLWMVWVPFIVEYVGKKYIMAEMSDETETKMFCGKWVFKNKMTPFRIYLWTYIIITILSDIGFTIAWVPVVGTIVTGFEFLILIPALILYGLVEYVYFRDLLNTLKPNNQSNVSTAIWITITNAFTFGLVRAIYLFNLSKSLVNDEPCREETTVEETTVEETTVEETSTEEVSECEQK